MDYHALIISLFFALGCAPLAFFQSQCPCCGTPCTACTNGTMSQTVQVDVAGITNGTCVDCNDLNATYILSISISGGSPCIWGYNFPSAVCFVTPVTDPGFASCNLNVTSSGPGGLTFTIVRVGTDLIWNTSTAPTRRDCNTWSLFNLPQNATTSACDNVSATCLVTTL
jgi:hypothetical protein